MLVTTKVGISFLPKGLQRVTYYGPSAYVHRENQKKSSEWKFTNDEWKSFYEELVPVLKDFIFLEGTTILNLDCVTDLRFMEASGLHQVKIWTKESEIPTTHNCTPEEHTKILTKWKFFLERKEKDANKLNDILEMLSYAPGGLIAKSLEEDFKSKIVN
jgi:hypothetical protein